MSKPLRCLLIEASEADVAPILSQLAQGGYAPLHERVETMAALQAALSRQEWDLIISGEALPGLDALQALKVVQAAGRDLPFIVVSDNGGGAAAAEMMRAGAHDYVMKDHLARLAPVVERELREAEERRARRRMEAALRLSEKQFRGLLEAAPDAMVITDEAGLIRLVNSQTEKLLGFSHQELSGRPLESLVPERLREAHRRYHLAFLQNPVTRPMGSGQALFALHRDGREIPVEISLGLLETEQGLLITAAIRDVSARRQAEEALREAETRYRMLVELSSDIIYLSDIEGREVFMNAAGFRLLEATPQEVLGQPWLKWIHPDDQEATVAKFLEMLRNGVDVFDFENRFVSKTGREIYLLHNVRVVRDKHGQIVGTQGIARDITERRRAEEALRFQAYLLDSVEQAVIATRLDGTIIYWNRFAETLYGWSAAEALGRNVMAITSAQTSVEQAQAIMARLQAGESWSGELLVQRRDGRTFPAFVTDTPIRDAQGKLTGIIGISFDITERRRMEDVLAASERRFRALIENSLDVLLLVGDNGRVLYASPSSARITGYPPEERLGRSFLELVHPEERAHVGRQFRQLLRLPGSSVSLQTRIQHRAGSWRWVEATGTNLLTDPAVQAVVINYRDITERKHAEEALRRREQEFRSLAENMPDIVARFDRQLRHLYVSRQIETVVGRPAADFIGRTNREMGFPTELVTSWEVALQRVFETGQPATIEFSFRTANGTLDFESRLIPEIASDGSVETVTSIARDITQRKHAAVELERHTAELAALYRASAPLLATGGDLVNLATEIVQVVTREFQLADCGVLLVDETHQHLTRVAHAGEHQVAASARLPLDGAGLTVAAFRSGEIVYAPDVRADARYVAAVEQTRSELVIPLRVGSRVIGVLDLQSPEPDAFDERAQRIVAAYSERAALALENARLLEETRRRLAEFEAVHRLSSALRTASSRSEMLPIILDQVQELLQVNDAAFIHHDPVSGESLIEVARGFWEQKVGLRLPRGQGVVGTVLSTGQPYVSQEAQRDPQVIRELIGEHMLAVAAVPLVARNRVIGALGVGSRQPLSSPQVRLFITLADIAANAIQRASLHDQTQRRAEQLAIVSQVGQVLAETLEPVHIYERLQEVIMRLLPDTITLFISLYDEAQEQVAYVFGVQAGVRLDVSALGTMPLEPGGQGTQSEAIYTRQPIIIPDLGAHLETIGIGGGAIGESALCVPMVVKGRVMGVVQVRSETVGRYTQLEAELLSLVANAAGAALESARLLSESQSRLEQLQALRAIDMAITGAVDVRVILNILLDHVVSQLHVDAAAVLLLNPHSQVLEHAASRGFRTRAIERSRIRPGEGYAGRAALERRMMSVNDLNAVTDFVRAPLLIGEGLQAYYGLPLVSKGKLKGVLEVFHRTGLTPDHDWLEFLETLAGQAAIAVDNAGLFDELQRFNVELTVAYDATIEGWSRALDLRDKETEGHSQRVTEMTLRLARAMGFSEAELVHVRRGALLHDIGKMGVPDSILLKPGPLTPDEWAIMRQHPTFAYEMLSPIAYLRPALEIPYSHHEKWDGTGYPRGLKSEQIPLAARIFAVADVWDALRSDRPYRPGWPVDKIREHIRAQAGKHFDPQVVNVFLTLVDDGEN